MIFIKVFTLRLIFNYSSGNAKNSRPTIGIQPSWDYKSQRYRQTRSYSEHGHGKGQRDKTVEQAAVHTQKDT